MSVTTSKTATAGRASLNISLCRIRRVSETSRLLKSAAWPLVMSETGWVSDAYYARFGNFPPVLYWRGTVKGLHALMKQALERGTPLTADELMKVQGHSEPPPEAKT